MRTNKIMATLILMISIIISAGMPVLAKDGINSEGNILFDNGDMALYASDIKYLEEETDNLLSELPILPDTNNFGGTRRGNIKSRGIIDYSNGQVVIDASDFTYLADEIDALEAAYKLNTVAALNRMGTYYMQDGSITHDESAELLPVEYAINLSFDEIYEGVLQSQSVENLATTEILTGASADNLTAGTASWVDGELIIGNGADNDSNYKKGYNDGKTEGYDEGYKKGYNDGKTAGYTEGYNAGRAQGQEDVKANPGNFGISTGISQDQFVLRMSREDFSVASDTYTIPHDGTCYLKFDAYASYSQSHGANTLILSATKNGNGSPVIYETFNGNVTNGGVFHWNNTIEIPSCTKGETITLQFNHNGADLSWIAGIY